MPSARILNDGLWHCLCPLFDLQVVIRPHRARRLKTNVRNGCSSSPTAASRRRLTTSAHARNGQQGQSVNGDGRDRGHFFTQRSPSGGLDSAHISPNPTATAIQLYDKLRLMSFKGNHKEIEDVVGVLVRDHHEQPNIRLYNALILSNIDPVNGSAAKVSRLLREMTKEGIIPESGTYHALLKVRRALVNLALSGADWTLCQVLAIHPDYNLRGNILAELRQRWFTLTNDGWHDVIAGLLKDKHLEMALNQLEQMQREGNQIKSWLYDMFVYTLCEVEEFEEASALIKNRIAGGEMRVSANLWFYLLDTASRALSVCRLCYR